jgi:hypothetical protein
MSRGAAVRQREFTNNKTVSKGYTEMPSPEIEPGTSVSGVVRRNQVPRLEPIGDISHIYTPVLPEQRAPIIHPLLAR